ncbi:hypothetical protein FGIG_12383, partial [Fasciola gigantica]
ASSKSTPELSTSSLNERNIATPLDPDPATVYTLEPPTGLLRLPVSCPNGDRSSLIRSLVDAEQQRVQFAQDALENTVGQKLDPWFIGLRYLQLIEQCTEQSGDFLAAYEARQQAFFTLTREWDEYHAMEKKSSSRDRKEHIDLLRSIQVS